MLEQQSNESIIPEKSQLVGNYPNPFNPTTTIVFELSEPMEVSLVIYDILGREILTLMSGDFKNAGQHSIMWNSRDNYGSVVPSGTYFFRFKAGEVIQTKAMIFLK